MQGQLLHSLSQPESKLHINFLELKAVILALKEFEPLCRNKTVLVATDNTTVVAYINKGGGLRLGSLCALLWRLLSWCNLRQIELRARHIPGCLHVITDKLPRHRQVMAHSSGGGWMHWTDQGCRWIILIAPG